MANRRDCAITVLDHNNKFHDDLAGSAMKPGCLDGADL
jgi:hypothetical protein